MRNYIALAIIAFLIAGCTESEFSAATGKLTAELMPRNFSLNSSQDLIDYPMGECMAMVCKNKTPPFPFNLFFDSSLKGGECSFKPCNYTEFYKYANKTPVYNETIRFFMFGAGQSFLSFTDANIYCNNSMKMAVKWLAGSVSQPYPKPLKARAECLLDKNVIPVYILYSNATNVNSARAGEIAAELNGAGPAVLVSESELDSSQSSAYSDVKNQILAMRSGCSKCIIALGIRLNGTSEYNVTAALLSDSSVRNSIDIIAYGLNSHNFADCNPDRMLYQAVNFSKYAINTYNKPSLITYVLFDEANSSDNSCAWDSMTVGNGYSKLYDYMPALASNAILGVSMYSLYGIGPLQCENCAFLNPNLGGGTCDYTFNPEKMEPRFSNYMGFCQAYYTGLGENISGVMPLVFSNGSANCNYAFNPNMMRFVDQTDTETRPMGIQNAVSSNSFYSCGGCVSSGVPPTNFPLLSVPAEGCTKFSPQLEIAADNFDMDPTLLRAAVWQESAFNASAVSYVPVSRGACNALNLLEVKDPDNCTLPGTEEWYVDAAKFGNPVSPCSPRSAIAPGNMGERCKPCAYGPAQDIDYPSNIYKENPGITIPDVVRICAAKTANGFPDFNPYRPYDGPCAYAYKYTNALSNSRMLVESRASDLNAYNESNKSWFSSMFALDTVFGHQNQGCHNLAAGGKETQVEWINDFVAQKGRTDCNDAGADIPCDNAKCCGNKDFMDYVKKCEHKGGFSYGYDTLAKYQSLINSCTEAYCPDTKKADTNIIGYLCNNKYMEIQCCNAAKVPLFGYSATLMCSGTVLPECRKYCR